MTILLPISRGILEHRDRMKTSIWEFLWFVDRVTEDVPDGAGKFRGLVLGGAPVSLAQIASDLKEHVDTAKRNVAALESNGYIVRQILPENRRAYSVVNSVKWFRRDQRKGINAPAREGINAPALGDASEKMHPAQGQECTRREGINAPANKETLQNSTKNATKIKSGGARPTLEQIRAYCKERNNSVDPDKWFNHYTANGFKVGTNPMKDWKAAVRNWETNGVNHANGNRAQQRQASNLAAAAEAKRDFGLVS
jgi:hypothetical protein